jgi:hypothetical protein
MTMKLRIAKIAWSIKIVFSIIISLGKSYNFVGTIYKVQYKNIILFLYMQQFKKNNDLINRG